MASQPELIFCQDGNPLFARLAVEAGWLYGARLPATVYQPVYFADQDWRRPDRGAYMAALAQHRPELATVIDFERAEQLPEVLSWAEEAAALVAVAVVIIPKAPGTIGAIPRRAGGKEVRLGYSVPTTYGGSPVPLWEHTGWPIHLLGGSPQEQLRLARYACLDVQSADGNMIAQQARKGRTWTRRDGHFVQLRDVGDDRKEGAAEECFRRSLCEVRLAWGAARPARLV